MLHELVEPQIDFALAGGGDFVMLGFDVEPALDHRDHHFVADVHQGIGGRHGEVAFLVTELVAEVGFALGPSNLCRGSTGLLRYR